MAKQVLKKNPAKKPAKPVAKLAERKSVVVKKPFPLKASPVKASKPVAAPVVAKSKPVPPIMVRKSSAARTPMISRPVKPARAGRIPDLIEARPVPIPVPTNGKPRKNQAGLSSRELEHFRELLLQKRRELVGDMSQMEREALRSAGGSNLSNLPLHMADMGTDNYEQEFTLGLVEKDRNLLREINSSLAKIQDGTYGICDGTNKPISKVRLEAQPWAKYSIEYARRMEKSFIRQ